ncbi:hypothetical protein F7725_025353 [Dissostichus mawsoni]|uniref:Uncharacterized protein n=1 Tax=Dissostichus mawsoni TaxID=36200 RepID=A0A7J5XBT7_DISMA|nr:hypothetical protein F7725_025353 [Dissostichus mawsoni]
MKRRKSSSPDKIEEAQKELKDPKGSQKEISESSRRNADNIKGLKRKKVVAENRLEKIPKSPVKKPLQLKTPETALHGTSSKETTPSSCCSSSNSPSHNPSASPGGNEEPQYAQPVAASLHKGSSSTDTEKLKQEEISSRPSSLEPVDGEGSLLIKESQSKDSTSRDPSFEGDPYHSSASLDVLLQAMEPDFSTLAERKSSLQVTAIEKPASILNAQYSATVPSTIQVPVTPGSNQVQMTTVMNFGADQVSKDQKLKKPGNLVWFGKITFKFLRFWSQRNPTEIMTRRLLSQQKSLMISSIGLREKLASVTLCPQQEPTASSKRMLSPANSLDIYMEKHQKRAKDEHGVACLTDGRSVNYLNSKMSEVTRQRKLTLVRQVCTTEPVDSPIETEAPPLLQDKTNGEKDSQATDDVKPMSPDSVGLNKDTTTVIHEEAGPALNTTTGGQGTSIPANITLKASRES